jgi:hypothetical protein
MRERSGTIITLSNARLIAKKNLRYSSHMKRYIASLQLGILHY